MSLTFSLKDFGRTFATRERGAELRELLRARAGGADVVVDFAEVSNVSYSFADEFLGVLVSDEPCTHEIQTANMAYPIDRIVHDVLLRRRGEPVAC